ncbi:hypothetical protein ABID65_005251 [Bradyrhizobium sp. S3.9.2]|uniref:hypothetical protein n=1 Tax=Bradyrhizobium sp. S3.9.2 TaxID=3156432 RepID=UPI003393CCAF
MELLLVLTYAALCYAIFKIFRIPVNQWTLVTAVLGGAFGLALLFITPVLDQHAHLFRGHPCTARGEGARDRGTG